MIYVDKSWENRLWWNNVIKSCCIDMCVMFEIDSKGLEFLINGATKSLSSLFDLLSLDWVGISIIQRGYIHSLIFSPLGPLRIIYCSSKHDNLLHHILLCIQYHNIVWWLWEMNVNNQAQCGMYMQSQVLGVCPGGKCILVQPGRFMHSGFVVDCLSIISAFGRRKWQVFCEWNNPWPIVVLNS